MPRVCQQLRRNCIGIEINPDYVRMIAERLSKPFSGFDSVDPRVERVPLDLLDSEVRRKYLENHKSWFLKNHENALVDFNESVRRIYGVQAYGDWQLSQDELRLREEHAGDNL